jgi:hypothetical protein
MLSNCIDPTQLEHNSTKFKKYNNKDLWNPFRNPFFILKQEKSTFSMGSPKTEFHTQCWGGAFIINLFLESQEKKRVVFTFSIFFFFFKIKYNKNSLIMKTKKFIE